MIELIFREKQGRLTGFTCTGHSGYAEAGSDIVCAAVSAAVGLVVSAITDQAHVAAKVKQSTEKACICLSLPDELPSELAFICETVLRALQTQLAGHSGEYPRYLSVKTRPE